MNQPRVHVSFHPEPPSHLPPHRIPLACLRAPALSVLLHASNLHWSSILHMLTYMFQCYSLKSSHPGLLPQSPKVCSLHLGLFCYLTDRVIITIFLNSLYICLNILYWCFYFWLISLCIIGSSFFFFLFYFIFKLYIIVLVLPNIKMNPSQVHMCSPS